MRYKRLFTMLDSLPTAKPNPAEYQPLGTSNYRLTVAKESLRQDPELQKTVKEYYSLSFRLGRLRWISSQRHTRASPMSFISKRMLNFLLICLIDAELFAAMSISSTYKAINMMLDEECREYMQGSLGLRLKHSSSTRKDWIFAYHCRGACLRPNAVTTSIWPVSKCITATVARKMRIDVSLTTG
eukprot:IDg10433t1